MDTEEDILVAIYINLIDMVMHLPGLYQPSNRLIASKKDIRNILLLRTALLANDKYEVAKRNSPINIRLDEDVLKTSFVFVFRGRLEDVLIKTNMFALALRLQKMSSRRLQDVLVKTNIFVLAICL